MIHASFHSVARNPYGVWLAWLEGLAGGLTALRSGAAARFGEGSQVELGHEEAPPAYR